LTCHVSLSKLIFLLPRFYLYRDSQDTQPIILVPTEQFVHFLNLINKTLNIQLTLPTGGGGNSPFRVSFENNGTPRPRYLGRSGNLNMIENLKNNIPSSDFKLNNEPRAVRTPSDRSIAVFQAKVTLLSQAQKGKKVASKEKQRKERIAKQQGWRQSVKRVQRYFGLREIVQVREDQHAAIQASSATSDFTYMDNDVITNAAAAQIPQEIAFHPEKAARFSQESNVVFVCVDVEAYEHNTRLITEIGIASLDTSDIKSLIPGDGGENWMTKIRARHFRINEHKHMNNTEFVSGCADKFEFG
jgi:hypothetical protein